MHPDAILQGALVLLGGLGLLLLAIARGGLHALVTGLMAIGVFFVSHVGVRVGPVLLADLFFIAAAVPIGLLTLSQPLSRPHVVAYRPLLALLGLLMLGGLLGTFGADNAAASIWSITRFVVASVGALVLFSVWPIRKRDLTSLALAFVLGAATSAVAGYFIRGSAIAGYRWMGLAGHPNRLAATSYLAVGLALGLASAAKGKQRIAWLSLGVLFSVTILNTGSRAGLVALGLTLILFLTALRQWRLLAFTVVGGLAGLSYFNPFTSRTGLAQSNAERLLRLRESVTAVEQASVVGSGFANARYTHSLYLELWASAGLLGLAFGVGLILLVVHYFRKAKNDRNLIALGMASAYLGQLAAFAFSPALWDRYLWIYLALLIAVLHHVTVGVDQKVVGGRSGVGVG